MESKEVCERQPDRRTRILVEAKRLFLRHGYIETTTDMIVAASGGSKREIYRLFGGKRALFQRAVEDLSCEVLASLRAEDPETTEQLDLEVFARRYIDRLLNPKILSLRRLVITEVQRVPEVAEVFLNSGPRQMHGYVAGLIERSGVVLPAGVSSTDAARLFLGALTADLQLRALLGQEPSVHERHRIATAAVAVLMRK